MRWMLVVGICVCCAPLALGNSGAPDPTMLDLRAEYPDVQFYSDGMGLSRIYGTQFAFGDSPEDTAAAFVTQYAPLFGARQAELTAGNHFNRAYTQSMMSDPETGGTKFTLVYYAQVKDGLPVYGADLRLLVRNTEGFPLVLAANSCRDLKDFTIPTGALGNLAEGNAYAEALVFEPGLVHLTEAEPVIWAGTYGSKWAPTLALKFEGNGANADGEPQRWRFIADGLTGELIHTESLIHHVDVSGTVNGMATVGIAADFCNPEVSTGMPYAEVCIIGGSCTFADVDGNFTIPHGGSSAVTVTSGMQGQYFYVDNVAGSEETLTMGVTPPGPADFLHNAANTSESIRAQVNGYIQANIIRDWVLAHHPTYPTISTQTNFPVYVMRTDGYCPGNAWYDGFSINFCAAGSGYANTAWQSVVHHEYGHHGVETGGSGQGEYGEGMSDVFAMLTVDDPVLGDGFTGTCGTGIRNADNTLQYPCDNPGSIHYCGQILSGCVWETREALVTSGFTPDYYLPLLSTLSINSILLHSGSSITPAIYTDFLTLDDDNGDLSDGTPHEPEITTGFNLHSMVPGPPPANDDCALAIAACPGESYVGSTSNATNDANASCATSNNSPDVWYTYTPGTNGTLTASLCNGTAYDSAMSIYSGCPGTLGNELACDDDACSSGGPSEISIGVTAGLTYLIRVSGWDNSAGPYVLELTGPACGGVPLVMTLPNGAPLAVPIGSPVTFDVQIDEQDETYQTGSAQLHYRYDGGSYQTASLSDLGGGAFEATLPGASSCDDTPEFYISAQTVEGSTVNLPNTAPASVFSSVVGDLTVILDDNFESDLGWTAANVGASSGDWQRGVPVDDPSWDYDPAGDSDGSGQCYLTQNETGNTDVDNGSVLLYSPIMDMSGGGVTIEYDYYLYLTNTDGSDRLLVEINSNGGSGAWTEIARHTTHGGLAWRNHTITQADLDAASVTLTSNMQLRFTANDADTQSIVEAGVDAVLITAFECQGGPPQYTLTANTSGQGSISMNPPGGVYDDGTNVTVEAIPDADWMFVDWTGDLSGSTNPTSILIDGDKSITANFAADCNGNQVPDADDISGGTSTDVNNNGTPDDCELIGDMNCDGSVDFGDINVFVDILVNGLTPCDPDRADVNGDGSIDFGDINPFVTLLTS